MRKVIVQAFVTLDGVMQAPGGPDEDRSGGFEYGGWSFHYWDDVMNEVMGAAFSVPFDLLLGRKTYDIFASYWPNVPDDHPEASVKHVFNKAQKYVASRTLKQADLKWVGSHLISDVPKEVAKLKQGEGPEISVQGSANLIQTLVRHDLVDEYRIWTFPVVVGKGKRLFEPDVPGRALKLVSSRTSTTGVTIGTYRPDGAIRTGAFAEPREAEASGGKK